MLRTSAPLIGALGLIIMSVTFVKSPTLVLAVASLFFAAVSLILMYKAGCVGDLKSGFGNPVEALHIEAQSLIALVLSLSGAGCAVFYKSRKHLGERIANAVGYPLIAGVVLWIVGVQIEGWVTMSCLFEH